MALGEHAQIKTQTLIWPMRKFPKHRQVVTGGMCSPPPPPPPNPPQPDIFGDKLSIFSCKNTSALRVSLWLWPPAAWAAYSLQKTNQLPLLAFQKLLELQRMVPLYWYCFVDVCHRSLSVFYTAVILAAGNSGISSALCQTLSQKE